MTVSEFKNTLDKISDDFNIFFLYLKNIRLLDLLQQKIA